MPTYPGSGDDPPGVWEGGTPLSSTPRVPPGGELADVVDELDERIRSGGDEEIEEADSKADAVEKKGVSADSDEDPTDNGPHTDAPD